MAPPPSLSVQISSHDWWTHPAEDCRSHEKFSKLLSQDSPRDRSLARRIHFPPSLMKYGGDITSKCEINKNDSSTRCVCDVSRRGGLVNGVLL